MTTAPSLDCSGRVAVVTGAAGQLGPVWVRALAVAGAKTVALAEPGSSERAEVRALEDELGTTVLLADITDTGSLASAANAVVHRFGAPHILVASAGIDHVPARGHALDLTSLQLGDVEQIAHTNVVGTMLTISAFGRPMVQAGRGSIIVIGSQYASVAPQPALYGHLAGDGRPFVKNPAYGASKAATVNLARHFAAHWGKHGVRVNALSPGGVLAVQDEDFRHKFAKAVPLGRMIKPVELAGPLLFLASDASSGLTGVDLLVDGGYSIW
jgi:NAD(P)-dependent dehydrogenase (short-subunit alcohol dehydrogenase family)